MLASRYRTGCLGDLSDIDFSSPEITMLTDQGKSDCVLSFTVLIRVGEADMSKDLICQIILPTSGKLESIL
jgi:hypothetical protein